MEFIFLSFTFYSTLVLNGASLFTEPRLCVMFRYSSSSLERCDCVINDRILLSRIGEKRGNKH